MAKRYDMEYDDEGHLIGLVGRVTNPIADCVITAPRKGYIYEHDAKLMDDGSTCPTRPPRVASLMATFIRFGPSQPFTLKEAVEANYDSGRQKSSMRYHSYYPKDPLALRAAVTNDWWVKVNVADNLQGAHRWHLRIILKDYVITVERIGPGVYMFHTDAVNRPEPGLMTIEEFKHKYQTKFLKESPWTQK